MTVVLIGGGGPAATDAADEIGGKAAGLVRIAAAGVPVPPAFVLPISLCARINAGDSDAGRELEDGLRQGIAFLEEAGGKRFGDRRRPLLVSVRSGAARSMPGMMDTVLDVGASPAAVGGLIRMTGDPRFAWDCRRRFIESYATVVLGRDRALFDAALAQILAEEKVQDERDLDGDAMERLALAWQSLNEDGSWMEQPMTQLSQAARAVYRSWMSERAQTYRRLNGLEDLKGTAVTVQTMVFGNRGLSSGAGVAFSRDPSTGDARPVVEALFDAQGEEVVSGRRTPLGQEAIDRALPDAGAQLRDILRRLEQEFRDVQDVEFTIEKGRLWILQTRPAKRSPLAALRIAIDLVREGVITPPEALHRLAGLDPETLVRTRLEAPGEPLARGIGASPGVAAGRAAFDSASAARLAAAGDPVILVRPDTSTADVAGFAAAAGIVTAQGGRTAHAALVARQMGKPCVTGCKALTVDPQAGAARCDGGTTGRGTIDEGEWITMDGDNGAVYLGRAVVVRERPAAELAELERWRTEAASHQETRDETRRDTGRARGGSPPPRHDAVAPLRSGRARPRPVAGGRTRPT
jgi:pyruvate, orthophosphate dikinase